METTIIFSHTETGHVLEYFHHIYAVCVEKQERRFVFVVPEGFKRLKGEQEWLDSQNVNFDYISESEFQSYQGASILRLSSLLTGILKRRIKKYNANKVFSLFWFPIVPFGVFRFPHGVKISTILYDVYLRELGELSFQAKLRHRFNFWLLSRARKIEKAFVLNDEDTAAILNKKFHTNHFQTLPDPYNPIPEERMIDLRKEYGIGNSRTIFAHFGGLDRRKGTLRILEAIDYLSEEERKACCFIFAGRVYADIKDEFYKKTSVLSSKVQIIINDEFCSYSYLASLCKCCDAILMPYENANRSSGLLGYASQFRKPVVAPNFGLIGRLVEKYKIGITGDVRNANSLADLMRIIMNNKYEVPLKDYCVVNSVERFCGIFRKTI